MLSAPDFFTNKGQFRTEEAPDLIIQMWYECVFNHTAEFSNDLATLDSTSLIPLSDLVLQGTEGAMVLQRARGCDPATLLSLF